jgi:quercetin dioxygenase-like cupin family protein
MAVNAVGVCQKENVVMTEEIGYFAEPSGVAAEPGRYVAIDADLPALDFAPGLVARPLVGRNLMASFVRYEPHSEAPRHAHEEEQVFIVLEGEIELELGDERRLMRPGEAALIPAFVPHAARTLDGPAYQIDVFSPPRKAMLRLLERRGLGG